MSSGEHIFRRVGRLEGRKGEKGEREQKVGRRKGRKKGRKVGGSGGQKLEYVQRIICLLKLVWYFSRFFLIDLLFSTSEFCKNVHFGLSWASSKKEKGRKGEMEKKVRSEGRQGKRKEKRERGRKDGRSGGQKFARSGGQKVARSEGRKVRRSEAAVCSKDYLPVEICVIL
jgi:hypothetical protein